MALEFNRRNFEDFVKDQMADQNKMVLKKLIDNLGDTTPVDTGVLKNNWYFSINEPSNEFNENITSGMESRERAKIERIRGNEGKYYVSNNTPYAGFVENGTPFQPAQNFTRVAINQTKREIR